MHSRCREKGRGISYRGKDLDIFLCTPCNCITTEAHPVCVQHHSLQQLALPGARGSPAAAVHPAPGSQLLMRGRGGQDTSYVFISYLLRIIEVEYIFFSYFSHIALPMAMSPFL